ncbi:MAG: hypothetical protein V4532_14760 [Pseudomonadota bacterium]
MRKLWEAVPMELWLIATGITGMVLVRRKKTHEAGVLVLVTVFFMLCGICLLLDVPSANVPRSTHNLLPALGACAFLLFRGNYPWLRHGVTLVFLGTYALLDATSFGFQSAYVLPEDIRALNAWGNDFFAMATLYMALQVMHWKPISALPWSKVSSFCTTNPRWTRMIT